MLYVTSTRTYYYYEFGRDQQHVALVAAINGGRVFLSWKYCQPFVGLGWTGLDWAVKSLSLIALEAHSPTPSRDKK
ncbi:hypothetical protein V2J09_001085 [Rumex salicifolius]